MGVEKTQTTLQLKLGALCEPIRKQLYDQGLKVDRENLEHFQKDADALTRLRARDLIAFSVVDKSRQKLINKIAKEAEAL